MSTSTSTQSDPRRWMALAILGLSQFMLVVDVTIVNVALPRIQHDLHFSHAGLAWVVNGYTLMAGGLLLLGGRMADVFGRRRLFLAGIALFAIASATSGAAASSGMLVSSRFAQGIGEALPAPAALGLIALLFPDPRERVKALGIWGGLAGLGGTTGTVISGTNNNNLNGSTVTRSLVGIDSSTMNETRTRCRNTSRMTAVKMTAVMSSSWTPATAVRIAVLVSDTTSSWLSGGN